jgi:Flp pilus assembly protein TadD
MVSASLRIDSPAAIAQAAQRGDVAGARRRGEALLASRPNDPGLLHLLGVLAAQSGDPARGAELLGRALRLQPGNDAIRANHARALIDTGRAAEAEQLCRTGSAPALRRLRADAMKASGRAGEAATLYRALAEAEPGSHELWNNLGTALLDAHDASGALAAFRRAEALQPDSAVVHRNLAKALAATGDLAASVAAANEAVMRAPGDANALLELGRAFLRAGRSQDAVLPLADAARADRTNPEIFTALGLAFGRLGEFDRAEEGYRLAIGMARVDPQAWLNLGILMEQGNRVSELDQLIMDARGKGVGGDEMAFLEALALRRAGKLAQALPLAQSVMPGPVDESLRQQLIGQLADRLGRPDEAFAAFTAMNGAMTHDPAAAGLTGAEHRGVVEQLHAMTTPEWFARWPSVRVDAEPPAPVFLVGFPRSGTTLLDTVLMGHPDAHVLEEEPVLARVRDEVGDLARLPDLDAGEINRLRGRYFDHLQDIAPAPSGKLVIDKLPLNILRTTLAHRLFPDARFIFAARHPCDCVLSCFMQNFRVNQAMASFLTLENAALFYDRVLAYWQRCRDVMPIAVHTIRYEDMVADLEGEIRPLLDFVGLPWREEVLDYRRTAEDRGMIRTPSYAQVTERIYARAAGRWEAYREHMAPVLPVLAPWAERLGYEPVTLG